MRIQKKSRIIDDCLSQVMANAATEEECLERYPEINQDLSVAFSIYRKVQTARSPDLLPEKLLEIRKTILFNLPERGEVVTKHPGLRYRWQNIKWRFAMTWVIFVATVLSLLSGAGVVYASNDALPGEFLFPVKVWTEDIQLLLAPDEDDVELAGIFSSRRVEELLELLQSGEEFDLDELLDGYRNRTELMVQAMERVRAEDPDEAVRLRTELETRLQEQTRMIESLLTDVEESDGSPLQEHIRTMLESNTQTRLRINQEEPIELSTDELEDVIPAEEPSGERTGEQEDQKQYENQNRNRVVYASDEYVDNGVLFFQFRFSAPLETEIFAEIGGLKYGCTVDDSLVTCDLTGSAGRGTLRLYDLKTNELLFTYDYEHDYEYLWAGSKEGGNEVQQQGDAGRGDGGQDNGNNGGNK